MPKITNPLTNTEVKNAKPKEKMYNLFDGHGLQLRVLPTSTKSWILAYKHPVTLKRLSLTLGKYPEISLADARELARSANSLIAKGIDPKEHKEQALIDKQEEASNSFEAVAQKWLKVKKSKVSLSHAEKEYRRLEVHVFPSLGKLPISSLKAPLVIESLSYLEASKILETLRRVVRIINEVMYFAVNIGVIEANPLAKIYEAFEAPTKQHFPTIKPDQLSEFLTKLSNASIELTTRCLIEWQLLTLVRPAEAATVEWTDLDFKKNVWLIPEHKMKGKYDHSVPLTGKMLRLLDFMRPISGNRRYVFPSTRTPTKHANAGTANTAIKRMGYGGTLVAHGLRALASTALNEQEFNADVIEKCLAHVEQNDVRKAYNKAEYMKQKREVLEWWSDFVEKAAQGEAPFQDQ